MRSRGIICLLMLAAALSHAGESRALIVCGDGGADPNACKRFENWTERWRKLLVDTSHFKAGNVRVLRSTRGDGKSAAIPAADAATLENVLTSLRSLAASSSDADQVVIIFVGHGYDSQSVSKFCLPGKDISDVDAARALDKLKARQTLVVNTAPCSSPWAQSLARKGRVIITATTSNEQRSDTCFGEFLLRAFQPGNVSALDAFNTAATNTVKFYQNTFIEKKVFKVNGREYQEIFAQLYPDKELTAGAAEPVSPRNDANDISGWHGRRILVETAGLEDNGDGQPSGIFEDGKTFTPLPSKAGDGEIAKTFFLGKP